MPSEYYIVCALPYSVSATATHHVSLFISPTIEPGADSELGRFRIFPDWGTVLRTAARIELFDDHGPIECEPLLGAVDPEVWRAAFPPETPVRGPQVPHWEEPRRKWRSFSARVVNDAARALHLATMYTDPTTPPAPTAHPATAELLELLELPRDRLRSYDESRMTAQLDRLVESRESLVVIEDLIGAEQNWLRRIALELHRCRRYYERPESQDPYRDHPDPDATPGRVKRREPEFHERCAMAGDHPALQRKLGLVVDLRVADPDRLRRSGWLSARIVLANEPAASRPTRVRCRAVGDDLVTVAQTAEWSDAALRLGDEALFGVLDLDADGSALKTDRFLWTLPRLLAIEDNADPVNAATPALRSVGLTVTRARQALNIQNRLARQHDLVARIAAGEAPVLSTEDVTRGVRVEVWDDTVKRWASLHRRRVDVEVVGHGTVLDGLEEDGFVQGTAAHETPGVRDAPVHVHDALFGWEGWSLSAPRPGKRVRHEAGAEIVEDTPDLPDADLTHPIRISAEVQPGTLPRLRYGRAYAFRAWAVDLAGNSPPHPLNSDPVAPPDQVAAALVALLPRAAHAADTSANLLAGLRTATRSVVERRRLAEAGRPLGAGPSTGSEIFDHAEAGPEVMRRLRARRGGDTDREAPAGSRISRAGLVASAFADAIDDKSQPFVSDTALRSPSDLADLVARHVRPGSGSLPVAAAKALATVTRPRPFVRWEPVPSPAVVPRHRYTEGESLRVLVVRSGVTQDPVTLAITITAPFAYAATVQRAHAELGYRGTSERHLAPPKISQVQAEQHGMFDRAIGFASSADQAKMLGWALREDGSFADLDRASLDNPPVRIPQPGISLVHNGTLSTAPKTLPLARGEPPAPGQYVIHDVDELALPYLPDPLAHGISVVFAEAGQDRLIPFPFGTEGFTATYPGDWPEIEPFRLVLAGAPELGGEVTGRVLTIALPPGDRQRFRLASSLTHDSLPLFGPWRSLPLAVQGDPDVAEAAADGWLWGLTPHENVQLVHAVPRPIEVPRATTLAPFRLDGETSVLLLGAVDVHGASTDSLIAEATWTDPIDDLTLPRWEDRPQAAVAFRTPIRPYEDLAVLGFADAEPVLPGLGKLGVHLGRHELGDTLHRVVAYRFRASTRFREYFHPDLLAADPNDPLDDGRSVVGPVVQVSVPSSAPPAAPVVHSVLPLFRWSDGTEPEQPMARRHTRRAGVRIYLERPWFSSGAGELLGVLLATGGDDSFGAPAEDESGFPFVSKWGGDPVWYSRPVPRRALAMLQLDDLLRSSGLDDRAMPGRPVRPPAQLPLPTSPGSPVVTVAGYRPQYNLERGLWYVDVALDPAAAFWPFLRLAVCRYQPEARPGCHLSAPVRCDFVQLPPERTVSVSRTDDRHVRVVLTGPIGLRDQPPRRTVGAAGLAPLIDRNRYVAARLQRRDPVIDTDLGWETVATTRLAVRGSGTEPGEVAWLGELDAGTPIPLARPGRGPSDWRVMIEEWEMLPGDPPAPADAGPIGGLFPVWERRLVYADEVPL